jgi:outer membrane protein TolC
MKNISKLMKSIIRLTIILLVLCVFGNSLKAQNNTGINADTALLNPSVDIEEMLPPLDSLYVIALKNNPLQKLEQAQANAAYWNIKYVKVLWTQGLGVFSTIISGTYHFLGQIVANNGGTEFISAYQGYRAGVNISLTVFDFIGRKPRVKQAEELWEVTKHKKEAEHLPQNKLLLISIQT